MKNKTNIFKVFRMIWYDARVSKQADLYYLSKIFSAFREATAKSKKRGEIVALRQYCRSLKRIYFNKLIEGADKVRRERELLQAAEDHYRYKLLRNHLDGWLQVTNREPQFISLAMTSKNAFKETSDHKWLQTKTVGFRQLN